MSDRIVKLTEAARGSLAHLNSQKRLLKQAEARNPRSIVVAAALISVGRATTRHEKVLSLLGKAVLLKATREQHATTFHHPVC